MPRPVITSPQRNNLIELTGCPPTLAAAPGGGRIENGFCAVHAAFATVQTKISRAARPMLIQVNRRLRSVDMMNHNEYRSEVGHATGAANHLQEHEAIARD